MKHLNAIITLKDAVTGTLSNIQKSQNNFISSTKQVKSALDKSYKLDKKDLESAIKDINSLINKNKDELKKSKEILKGWQELTETSATNLKKLSKEVQELSIKKQKLTSEFEKLDKSASTETIKKYEKELKDLNTTLKDKTTALNKAKTEHNRYNKELSASQKEVSKLDITLSQLNKKLDDFSKKSKNKITLQDQSNNINRLYNNFDNQKNKYSGFDKLGGTVKNIGKNLSLGVSLPVSVGFTASIKKGMDFETALSSVEATLGDKANEADMSILRQKAIDMGESTTKSATESANAMEYMALAGWDTSQIIGGIEPILRLSEAGKSDLATTSDLVTDSMSALGLKVSDLGGFLDKVSKSATSSNTSITQMMEAFIVAGGKSSSLGGDVSELSSILGLMANRGIKGAEAGRGLSAILTNLTSPTGQAKKALDDLGLSAFDSDGNFIGLEKTFYKLQDALKDMTQEQKVTYMSMISGKEHSKTLEGIISGLGDEYNNLHSAIKNSDGALAVMADTMQNNAQGKVTNLSGKLEALAIKTSDILLPAFGSAVDFLSNLIDKFSKLPTETQNTIVILGLLAIVIPPVISVVGGLISAVSTIKAGLSILKITMLGTSDSVGLLSKAFTFISQNPIILVVGAIAGIVSGIIHLWKTNEGFRDAVHSIWQGIVESVEWATNKIIDGINWIIDKINAIPFINIKTVGSVEWSDKSKKQKLDGFKASGALQASKDTPLLAKGYNMPLIDGSYESGLSYVPYDGFIAELHKGERVLTADENRQYNANTQKNNVASIFGTKNNDNYGNNHNYNTNNHQNNNNINIVVNIDNKQAQGDLTTTANKVAEIIANKIRTAKINVI